MDDLDAATLADREREERAADDRDLLRLYASEVAPSSEGESWSLFRVRRRALEE